MSKVLIALPAYNEASVISDVILRIQKAGYTDILVVDDGSKDNTSAKALDAGANVVTLPINRGAGAATATALTYAKRHNYDFIVLMDADGQHNPKDIARLLEYSDRYDVVIGSRLTLESLKKKDMPLIRKILNTGGSFVTWLFFGLYVADSQSGFKVFNKKAMNAVRITFDRYEFCSEIIGEIKRNNLTHTEVPIEVIYTAHSKAKGQNFWNAFKMIARFLIKT